jgi:outer membrane immunogenic protein
MRLSILTGAALGVMVIGPASAADIGAPPEPLPAPPNIEAATLANDWTGFYLGALGGFSWGQADTDVTDDVDVDGLDVGGYAGANWQWGNFVIGAEGDVLVPFGDGSNDDLEVEQGLNGSLRGRAGIALDRFLLYGTGGAAVTELELSGNGDSEEDTLWGWTAGAGVEGLILDNVTARVEYRYTDYEDQTFTLGGTDVENDFTTHAIRGGVGLKF